EKKPTVVGDFLYVVEALFHGPVILPSVSEVNVVDDFASDQFNQRILHLRQLIAPEHGAIVMKPFAPTLNRAQANFGDDAHRSGRKSKQAEQIRQMNPFLKWPKRRALVRQRA